MTATEYLPRHLIFVEVVHRKAALHPRGPLRDHRLPQGRVFQHYRRDRPVRLHGGAERRTVLEEMARHREIDLPTAFTAGPCMSRSKSCSPLAAWACSAICGSAVFDPASDLTTGLLFLRHGRQCPVVRTNHARAPKVSQRPSPDIQALFSEPSIWRHLGRGRLDRLTLAPYCEVFNSLKPRCSHTPWVFLAQVRANQNRSLTKVNAVPCLMHRMRQ